MVTNICTSSRFQRLSPSSLHIHSQGTPPPPFPPPSSFRGFCFIAASTISCLQMCSAQLAVQEQAPRNILTNHFLFPNKTLLLGITQKKFQYLEQYWNLRADIRSKTVLFWGWFAVLSKVKITIHVIAQILICIFHLIRIFILSFHIYHSVFLTPKCGFKLFRFIFHHHKAEMIVKNKPFSHVSKFSVSLVS